MVTKRILVIHNPAAQGGESTTMKDLYVDFLKQNLIEYELYTTNGVTDYTDLRKLIDKSSFEIISIIGGDGTVNLAVNGLPHLKTPIHIIPAGSGNDFAKMIYNKMSTKDIFHLALSNDLSIKNVDLWNCNSLRFINGFGAGFDGAVANKMAGKKYWISSKIKYWVEIIRHIFFYTSEIYTINEKQHPVFMLALANGQVYGGDFKIAPKAKIDDQLLDVVRVKKLWVPLRFFYLPFLQSGKHLDKSIVDYSQNSEVYIYSDTAIPAHLDGEPLIEKEYRIKREGTVKVLC